MMKRVLLILWCLLVIAPSAFAATAIRQRGDTAANWTVANPILAAREVGWETDTRKQKIGDGVTAWNALPYVAGGSVDSVNGQTGVVSLGAAAVGADPAGTAAAQRTAHEGAPDPHSQYTSAAEAAAAAPVQSVAGRSGAVTLGKADVGLPNVDDTSDLAKPVSTAVQAALDGKADLNGDGSVGADPGDGQRWAQLGNTTPPVCDSSGVGKVYFLMGTGWQVCESDGLGGYAWQAAGSTGSGLPEGGTAGQVVIQGSPAAWADGDGIAITQAVTNITPAQQQLASYIAAFDAEIGTMKAAISALDADLSAAGYPTLTLNEESPYEVTADATLTGTFTPGNGTPTALTYTIDGGPPSDITPLASPWSLTIPAASLTANGTNTVAVTVTNSNGLTRTKSIVVNYQTAVLGISPPSWDAGTLDVGTPSTPQHFDVDNAGQASGPLGTFAFSGTDSGMFAIGNNTCGATLAGGANCGFDVTFTPGSAGAKTASVGDGTLSATLSGTGQEVVGNTPPSVGSLVVGTISTSGFTVKGAASDTEGDSITEVKIQYTSAADPSFSAATTVELTTGGDISAFTGAGYVVSASLPAGDYLWRVSARDSVYGTPSGGLRFPVVAGYTNDGFVDAWAFDEASGTSNAASLVGGTQFVAEGAVAAVTGLDGSGYARKFAGDNQRLSAVQDFVGGLPKFMFHFLYRQDSEVTTAWQAIAGNYAAEDGTSTGSLYISLQDGTDDVQARLRTSSGLSSQYDTNFTPVIGQVYDLKYIYDGSRMKLVVDGTDYGFFSMTGTVSTTTNRFALGANGKTVPEQENGCTIDNFRIIKIR